MLSVPVVDFNQTPLMPTTPNRAQSWIESGKATPFWKRGVFCVRLNIEPLGRETQPIVVGVDPGSKQEGFTVKSASRTYLNIQAGAITWVKDSVDVRRIMRRARRQRHTPYRKCRSNRSCLHKIRIPPSTKARWQWKLRLLNWIRKMFPITEVIVEDIKAISKPCKRAWNRTFSPLQVGKTWFHEEVRKFAHLTIIQGWETAELRKQALLSKTKKKLDKVFEAHCVDSWVLANSVVGGHTQPENRNIVIINPIQYRRRSLHLLQPGKNGLRRRNGGMMSEGIRRGRIVKHKTHGFCYIGGTSNGKLSLHKLDTGERFCRKAKISDIKLLAYSNWRLKYISIESNGLIGRGE